MVPHASTSNGRRRGVVESDYDDDNDDRRRQPVAGPSKQRHGGGAPANGGGSGHENAYDLELAVLELDHPEKTMRHLFLQTLMSRKVVPFETARALYRHCVKLCKGELHDGPTEWSCGGGGGRELTDPDARYGATLAVKDADAFETFVTELEPGLSLCGLDIKTTRDEDSGTSYIALVSLHSC